MARTVSWTTSLASVQWLIFIFANTIVVPISVGAAFDLSPQEITGILRSSLVFTGIFCVLQGLIGHRLPLMEGHSGVMWGVVLHVSLASSSMGVSLPTVGGSIATGMLLAGAAIVLLAVCNLLSFIHTIISSMVMNVFLFLLTVQLNLIFFKGMLKLDENGALDVSISMYSIGIVILVFLLKVKGNKAIGNFSILIGMIAGWILYLILFPSPAAVTIGGNSTAFPLFPFGPPSWNTGIIIVTFLASLVNLSNTLASIQAASRLLGVEVNPARVKQSYVLTGAYSITGAVFGLVSYAPFASSIGFLESTQIFNRKPFLIAGGMLSVLGLLPFTVRILATLPVTVGYAVLFVAYLQLLGTSLKSVKNIDFNSITIYRIAIPLIIGICIMHTDVSVFKNVPVTIQPFLSNGLVMGVFLSIILEKCIRWET
ncbi:uracil/xanthine transporter [Paenibacillus silviterrae]|uniref:uracil/xanthine transporter n=1 Tax=Paenibacillus silviterrae TaxID=3242194 RepID=UPI002543840B|nr:uracil/xanthine transporter [Paenibacillus chinjuensis]